MKQVSEGVKTKVSEMLTTCDILFALVAGDDHKNICQGKFAYRDLPPYQEGYSKAQISTSRLLFVIILANWSEVYLVIRSHSSISTIAFPSVYILSISRIQESIYIFFCCEIPSYFDYRYLQESSDGLYPGLILFYRDQRS